MTKHVPAALVRGGTSKGLFVAADDVERAGFADERERDEWIAEVLGSPDATGMQLDGVGAGISSTSKVCIVRRAGHEADADLEWEFGQVGIKDGVIDWSGSCGNLASALVVFARDVAGLLPPGATRARVWQPRAKRRLVVEERPGDEPIAVSGVPGRVGTPVDVTFLDDGDENDGLLFPTGRVVDALDLGNGRTIPATLMGHPNPTIVVSAKDQPPEPDVDAWLATLRERGARALGMAAATAATRVAVLREPEDYEASSGEIVRSSDAHVFARITTPGRRWHHAMTGTGASALALAACVPGSLVHSFASNSKPKASLPFQSRAVSGPTPTPTPTSVVIAHPGGCLPARARVTRDAHSGVWRPASVGFVRTARVLLRGFAPVA